MTKLRILLIALVQTFDSLNFTKCANDHDSSQESNFFSVFTGQFLPPRSQSKSRKFHISTILKNRMFRSVDQISVRSKLPKLAVRIDLSQYSHSSLNASTSFISSTKFSIEYCALAIVDSFAKSISLRLVSES